MKDCCGKIIVDDRVSHGCSALFLFVGNAFGPSPYERPVTPE
jgi:hypothetical protein